MAPKVIIGAGTGLGVAGLLHDAGGADAQAQAVVEHRGQGPGLLGDQGLQIVSRLMGLFVCALAAQIIFTGVKNYLMP